MMRGMDLDDFVSHRGSGSASRHAGGKLAARIDVPKLLDALGLEHRPPRGSEIWLPCPFHEEREPSFQIKHAPQSPENGLWRCFGCKATGNAIGLVKELLGGGWAEARRLLDEGGVIGKPPPLPTTISVEIVNRRIGFALPIGITFAPLARWVTPPRRYAEKRGITPEQVVRWSIGYSIEGRLRGRIVLPLLDRRTGKPIGYTARAFDGNPKRYLEPDRKERATSGAVFGERHWPEPAERDVCIVTEGGLNGLAVERAVELLDLDTSFGAVRGSNLLPGHVARLSTFRRVLVASDPDAAGDGLFGALRGALGRWTDVVRVTMPKDRDCNDLDPSDLAQRIFDALSVNRT